jgi:hypothetical protein
MAMSNTLRHVAGLSLLGALLLAGCGPVATPPTGQTSPSPSVTASPSAPAPSPLPTAAATPSPSPQPVACWPVKGGPAALAAAGQPSITDIRAGLHDTYDRLVVQFTTEVPSYQIELNPWTSPPGGMTFSGGARGDWVTLQGSFGVQLVVQGLASLDDSYAHGKDLFADYPVLKEVRLTGDYEGVVTLAVGLSGGVCPTVTTLQDPPRLVIDFPHH